MKKCDSLMKCGKDLNLKEFNYIYGKINFFPDDNESLKNVDNYVSK